MHIIHLSNYYWPHQGGVEKHLWMLNQQLIERGFKVTVLTQQDQPQLPEDEMAEGVRVKRFPVSGKAVRANFWQKLKYKLLIWWGVTKFLPELWKADVIQVHDVFWWLLPLWPLLFWKKIYITFHGYEGNHLPTPTQVFWHRLAAALTRGNLCIGGFHQQFYGVKPDQISYGAVDHYQRRSVKTTSRSKLKLVFVGRLDQDTGILVYLKAIQILAKSQKINFELDIYGDGPLLKKLQHWVKKYHLPVKFKGWVDDVSLQLPNYDLALVSQYLSILEAVAMGVPVIAVYQNQLKASYLQQTPFSQWIKIVATPHQVAAAIQKPLPLTSASQRWIKQQTWQHLADQYQLLWQK